MKKVLLFVAMFLCIASSMEAGHRSSYGSNHRSSGGDSYTHSIGGMIGNMFGVSYKGFIFGVEGLALQADLAVKLQLSPTKDDIRVLSTHTEEVKVDETIEIHDSYNWRNYTFELNPNFVYQKELGSAGRSTFAMFGGGGVSLGFMKSLDLSSFGWGDSNPMLGKFGVNGIFGMEFIWSHFVLTLDARPGYGLAFGSKEYKFRGGDFGLEVLSVNADRNLRHFFDFGASIGMRYCF